MLCLHPWWSCRAQAWERGSASALAVLDQEMAVDPDYYIDQQLKLPVLRLFENVLDDAEKQIFSGDHTRKVTLGFHCIGSF